MSDTELRYCANGCTRRDGNERNRVQLHGTSRSRICTRCEGKITEWLTEIPDHYALLPGFTQHGTTEKNPDRKATKRAEAAAPMRLEVVDLLDERLGRKWAGLTPTGDRRGTIGTLQAWTNTIHEGRQFTTAQPDTVVTHCAYLRRHLFWATEQDWISDMSSEIKNLHRALSDAAGIYRRPPVGRCHVIPEDGDKACGGPLFASDYGGVHCARCAASWDANHLRQLGLAQAEQESA